VNTRTRWVVRGVVLVALVAGLYLAFELFDYEPRPLPLALLVTVCLAVGWLVVDVLGDLGPGWEVPAPSASSYDGQDARLATYLRVLEGHVGSAGPDDHLRDRLAVLADRRLAQRHGLRRDEPAARELLGPDLLAVLDGPPRRLKVAEIDRHLRRIEEL
jgi:hypothetical protein